MFDLGIILGIIVSLVAVLVAYLYLKLRRPVGFPPGPPAVPILGSFPFMNVAEDGNIFPELTRLADQYGPVFSMAIGHTWVVVLNDFSTIKDAMLRQGVDFAGRPLSATLLKVTNPMFPALGVVDDTYTDQWKLQRQTTSHVLRALGQGRSVTEECIQEEAEMLTETLKNFQGFPLAIQDHVTNAVLNVIVSVLFGDRYDYDDAEFRGLRNALDAASEATEKVMGAEHIPGVRLLPSHRRNVQGLKVAYSKVNAFIQTKITDVHYDETVDRARNFVEGYHIEKQKNVMIENRLFQNASDFIQAGLETVTTTVGWAIYYVVAYPRVQTRVQDELDHVVGRGRKPRLSDRENLPYVEATLLETLRLATTAPSSVPHETIRDSTVGDYNIPRGTQVWVNIWAVLRDGALWRQPMVFKPERFLSNDGKLVPREELIAFGIGRRSCLGEEFARQEIFLLFTHLLHALRLLEPDDDPLPPPSGTLAVTHRPPDFSVLIEDRD